jgi:ribosomal protein L14
MIAGMGLALLFGGLVPLLRSKTGSVMIYEKNRAVLIAETAGVAGLTIFGMVKLAQVWKG